MLDSGYFAQKYWLEIPSIAGTFHLTNGAMVKMFHRLIRWRSIQAFTTSRHWNLPALFIQPLMVLLLRFS